LPWQKNAATGTVPVSDKRCPSPFFPAFVPAGEGLNNQAAAKYYEKKPRR